MTPSQKQKVQDRAFDKGARDWNRDRGIATNPLREFVSPSYAPPDGQKTKYNEGRRYAERKHEARRGKK